MRNVGIGFISGPRGPQALRFGAPTPNEPLGRMPLRPRPSGRPSGPAEGLPQSLVGLQGLPPKLPPLLAGQGLVPGLPGKLQKLLIGLPHPLGQTRLPKQGQGLGVLPGRKGPRGPLQAQGDEEVVQPVEKGHHRPKGVPVRQKEGQGQVCFGAPTPNELPPLGPYASRSPGTRITATPTSRASSISRKASSRASTASSGAPLR